MKKLLMVLAFAGVSFAAMAQDEDPTLKYSVATNSFWSNWFIQANARWDAWYSAEEHGSDLAISPFKDFRSNPGVSIAIGKWFTPGLGLRTKLNGIWGKKVRADLKDNPLDKGNKFWNINEHILFNVSNMLLGYDADRIWNFIPFVGGGVGRCCSKNLYAMDLSAGLLNEFRLSRKLFLNLEIGWNRFESDIDGGPEYFGERGWDTHDNNLYAELGLTFNLGKATWDKTPDVDAIKALSQAQIDDLNAQLIDANGEIDRLNDLVKNLRDQQQTTTKVEDIVVTPVTVFFYCDKTKSGPAYQRDLVDVRELANFAVKNNRNLLVTGYADSCTSNPEHNQWLSDERAKNIVEELVGMGVQRNKITAVGKGGVQILSPCEFNRRVTVEVTK